MMDIDQITGPQRTCNKCQYTGCDEHFVADSSRPGGRRNLCKECDRERARNRHTKNSDEINARRRERYDPDAARESNKKFYENNKDKFREYAKAAWASTDKDAERERAAKWRAENPDKVRAIWSRKDKKRRSTAKGKIEDAISRGIVRALREGEKAGRRAFDLLGYTLEDLMSHLERRFKEGMSWNNYGDGGWEIDHIIPRAAFNYETPEDLDFKRCWALSNLQPLWQSENRSKRHRLDAPFQPSLALSVRVKETA